MTSILDAEPRVVSVGLGLLADALEQQGVSVERVDWRPPADGDEDLAGLLAGLWRDDVDRANAVALERLSEARPVLLDVRPAGEAIPGMTRDTLLHAGPPIGWERMSGPLRGAIVGALLYEGLADDAERAAAIAASGDVRFDSCHHHQAVGPMAGVTSYSMPVFVLENATAGNRAYSTLNEGLGRVLRYGALGADVLERLRWMQRVLGPCLGEALRRVDGGIDVRALIAQAIHMGDECHNRNRAASALLIKALAPRIAALDAVPTLDRQRVLQFAGDNEHFFLNVGMAACKSALDAAHGVPSSSLVTAMARNGTDFGIRVSGLGDRWFVGPANTPVGLTSRAQAPPMRIQISATAPSPKRPASAGSPWPRRPPSCSSSAALRRMQWRTRGACTRLRWRRARPTRCRF
jgi:hypothetical protein